MDYFEEKAEKKTFEPNDVVYYKGDEYEVVTKTGNGYILRNEMTDDFEVWGDDVYASDE